MCKCLLVSLGQHLVLITLIVEKAASQLYVEPNMVKMYRATFLRPGKAVSETIWSQKVAGSVLSQCSFRATSSNLLFQGHICLEIQLHLEKPSICPLELLCDFL